MLEEASSEAMQATLLPASKYLIFQTGTCDEKEDLPDRSTCRCDRAQESWIENIEGRMKFCSSIFLQASQRRGHDTQEARAKLESPA